MKAGGKKEVVIPSWLMSYSDFGTEEQYLAKSNSCSDAIYEIEVKEYTKNIQSWQVSNIADYLDANQSIFQGMGPRDTIKGHSGCYYHTRSTAIDTSIHFPNDTTIYINYTGKLLNGLVFDTTIENLAKDNHLYSGSKTYEPAAIKWGETHADITLDGSNVVSGFSQTVWNMVNCAPGTKAVGVFYSDLGYGYNGSGSIPPYAPLVFEIEIVEKPE
jgi:hypothetical protein